MSSADAKDDSDWVDVEGTQPGAAAGEGKGKVKDHPRQRKPLPALKAANWIVTKHNAEVYDYPDMRGNPTGYLHEGAFVTCLNRANDQGMAIEHEGGYTHKDHLEPFYGSWNDLGGDFSRQRHSYCCLDMRAATWSVFKWVLVCGVAVLIVLFLGWTFIIENQQCPAHIRANNMWRHVFRCDATHKGWTPQALEHEQTIRYIVEKMLQTWDVSKWKDQPKTLEQYVRSAARQHTDRDLQTVLDRVESIWYTDRPLGVSANDFIDWLREPNKELAKIHKFVDGKWYTTRNTVDRFMESMFQECPKPVSCPVCKEPEPCPTTCPACPVRYSSAAPALPSDGFCVPCPICSTPSASSTPTATTTTAAATSKTAKTEESAKSNKDVSTPDNAQGISRAEILYSGDKGQTWRAEILYPASVTKTVETPERTQPKRFDDSLYVDAPKVGASRAIPVWHSLESNHAIFSDDRRFMMAMQPDCNLVIYRNSDVFDWSGRLFLRKPEYAVWSSDTYKKGGPNTCELQVNPRSVRIVDTRTGKTIWMDASFDGLKDIKEVVLTNTGPKIITV